MARPTRMTLAEANRGLEFVEEQTAALEHAVAEAWPPDAIAAIEADRDQAASNLRLHGYESGVDDAIARGKRGFVSNRTPNKKKPSRKTKKGAKKKGRKKAKPKYELDWEEHKEAPNVELHSAPLVGDMRIVVGRPKGGRWRVGYWTEDRGFVFFDEDFDKFDQAKKAADAEGQEALRVASDLVCLVPRAANREVGDVVLAARQYQRAIEDEMAAMDRGTPEQLATATKRKKEAKEALEDMTGANRELLGAIGGAAVGAALGGIINPIAAAIGALAAGALGSVIAAPSLPEAPTPDELRRYDRDRGRGAEVLPFTRRSPGGRTANPDDLAEDRRRNRPG